MDFHHNHQQQQQFNLVSDKMPQRHRDQYDSMVSDTPNATETLNLRSEQQLNCGLVRYRSAPSSCFASCLDATSNANNTSIRAGDYLGDELDNFLNGLMPSNHISAQEHGSNPVHRFPNSIIMNTETEFVASRQHLQKENCYSSPIGQPQDQQNFNPVVANATSSVDDSYRFLSWNRIDKGVTNSNLIRYNSSPAGLIAAGNIANEYGAIRGMENIGAGKNANAGATFASTSKYTRLSSGQQSSGLMSPLPKIATRSMGENDPSKRSEGAHITRIPVVSWDDSSLLSDSFLEGLSNEDNQSFSNEDNEVQNAATTGAPTLLSRHLSLPMTSTELSGVETLMQDSVLCKLRAKRGCATHPRSIAERVRRTRISERMRKLQELVPNMEKQSNTADMLDMAVDYIKALQNQAKALSEKRAKCTCSKHH